MLIFPAIDMIDGQPVRLYQGDYDQKEVVAEDILETAKSFEEQGATWIHLVDLDGAKAGEMKNLSYVKKVKDNTSLKIQIGGGIRNMETVDQILGAGVDRVILGTAAVRDPKFLQSSLDKYDNQIAVGVDILDGEVKVSGWLEETNLNYLDFIRKLADQGVKTMIVTDISKDGAMKGTNRKLYKELNEKFESVNFIASGGVSSIDDIEALADQDLYGAIIGKAIYNGAINLKEAIERAEA